MANSEIGTNDLPTANQPHGHWAEAMALPRSRHEQIGRTLASWSAYQNWSEQMKGTFEFDESHPRDSK
jgi:hypothetical protein